MRQCPLKHKECPLKRPLVGRVVRSFGIQVAKATNGQTNGSAEESTTYHQSRASHALRTVFVLPAEGGGGSDTF